MRIDYNGMGISALAKFTKAGLELSVDAMKGYHLNGVDFQPEHVTFNLVGVDGKCSDVSFFFDKEDRKLVKNTEHYISSTVNHFSVLFVSKSKLKES